MKIKTSELTGFALDWAVAQIELQAHDGETNRLMVTCGDDNGWKFKPSTDWAQGGPIIERERISVVAMPDGSWQSQGRNLRPHFHNPTPLIAAMRCYVASKLGDEVDVPDELV